MNTYKAVRSIHDSRVLEVWQGGICRYFALHVLPECPPNCLHALLHGFPSRKALTAYCAGNGFALFRCYNS